MPRGLFLPGSVIIIVVLGIPTELLRARPSRDEAESSARGYTGG